MGAKGLRAVLITYMVLREPENSPETKRKNAMHQIRKLMGVSASVPRLGMSNSVASLGSHRHSHKIDRHFKQVNIDQLLKTERLTGCELIVVGMVGLRPQMKAEVPDTLM